MGGVSDAARPAENAWQTLEGRLADARATDGGGSVMPRGPRKTQGKRSSDGRPTLARRTGATAIVMPRDARTRRRAAIAATV